MVVLFGQPFWLVLPFRDTANPLNTAANFFAVLRDGFLIFKEKEPAMTKSTAQIEQNQSPIKQKTNN